MDIKEILKKLASLWGVSGFEDSAQKYLVEKLNNICEDVSVCKGNIYARLKNRDEAKKTVLLEAHFDRIGLCVSEIKEGGFARFKCLGGVDERTLPASEVYILGKEKVFGVIGALPPHLKDASSDEKKSGTEGMFIDTGLDENAEDFPVSVGDPVLLKSEFTLLANGIISMAAIDNRGGVAAILGCIERLKGQELPYNVEVAFTVGEELGLQGAASLCPDGIDLAIVIDATHGRTPDAEKDETFTLGGGFAICRGPNVDFDITNRIISFAREKDIPFEVEVASGNTGTDAWAIQILGEGVPCALISIPVRYMHTAVETASICDIEGTASFVEELIRGGGLFA